LVALPYYDHVESILRAKLPPPARVDKHVLEQTMKAYQVNEPQANAIVASMNTDGFSLIQG
jgi:senataxin